jgi:hypothetical protein
MTSAYGTVLAPRIPWYAQRLRISDIQKLFRNTREYVGTLLEMIAIKMRNFAASNFEVVAIGRVYTNANVPTAIATSHLLFTQPVWTYDRRYERDSPLNKTMETLKIGRASHRSRARSGANDESQLTPRLTSSKRR